MNAKKKLVEYLLVIALYFLICVALYASSASAQPFPYSKAIANEIEFNYFEANITTSASFTPQQIEDLINSSAEKSPNINLKKVVKIPSGYLVYGSLIDYSIPFNKLFNPWFNTSWEKRTTYNMSNVEYRKIVNMSNGDGAVLYNKSDRWFDHITGEQLQIFNYTLIGGQTFVHIRGNLNGNTQWDKYVNTTNSYPGVENATQTYNFWDNISQTQQWNQTKWFINAPIFMVVTVVGDSLKIDCSGGCDAGQMTTMQGNENLTHFSNIIYDWYPLSAEGLAGGILRNKDYSVTSYTNDASWVRQDDLCWTGTTSTSSGDVCVIPAHRQTPYINTTPYNTKFYKNDTLLDNKTTNIHNGQEIPSITSFLSGTTIYMYSVIGYNRSANSTFTQFQTLTYSPMNFTSWSNSRTNDQSLSITAPQNTLIMFNASTSVNCDNCSWYVNGVPYANFTSLKDTSLNYTFLTISTYNINLIAINSTFSNASYLNWTVTITPQPTTNLDGFVNNTLGAYVDAVRIDLINLTGTGINRTAYSHSQFLTNNTDLAPMFGNGQRVVGTTYWANNTSVQVFLFTHNPGAGDIDVDFFIDGVPVQDDDVHITAATTGNRSKWVIVPQGSNYSIELIGTPSHHYSIWEYQYVIGYYFFKNVPTGNYSLLFQQVGYDNHTHPILLASNTRYNATLSPTTEEDNNIFNMAFLGFIIGFIALALIVKHRKLLKHDGIH